MSSAMPTAQQVATYLCASIVGDGAVEVVGVCSVTDPQPDHLCFASNAQWLRDSDPGESGTITICRSADAELISGTRIIVEDPRRAFGLAAHHFFVQPIKPLVADSAKIAPDAKLGQRISIGENCIVGPGVKIGDDTRLLNNVVLGARVRIGARCVVGSNTVIGEVGFGLAKDSEGRGHRLPHMGSVEIGDDVEIGALVSVAAGTISPTRLADGVRLDDHVFIAHNVALEENVMVIACAEISGSVRVGRNTWIGPNVSIRDGVTIPAESLIGIGSTVVKTLTEPGIYAGVPAKLMKPNSA